MSDKMLAGRYRVRGEIGEGGMAIVYRATDIKTGHDVAIKVLKNEYNTNSEYILRFQREAEAAAKMTHYNIVNLLDVGTDGMNRYLVMEYVEGRTLKKYIEQKGRLDAQKTCEITRRILAALKHAHEKGIIHRDIKPQNILLSNEGSVKVSDFGIARIANSGTLTRGDAVMGSVHYFSPEQASGKTADERSDLYSVGVCMYEMLTGHVPFNGNTAVEVAMAHINRLPDPIEKYAPNVPPAVAHVCMMALAKNPAARYQSAEQMGEELHKVMMGDVANMLPRQPDVILPVSTTGPITSRQQPAKPGSKLRRTIISVILAAAVVLALYYGGLAIYDRVVNGTEAPDLLGMDQTSAERSAQRSGLNVSVVPVYHASVPAGNVILQTPEEGTAMRRGDTIVLTVSRGVSMQIVPSVYGQTTTEAFETLRPYGLTLTVTERVVSEEPVGSILSQYPETGSPCQNGDVLQVTVSGGSTWVPNLSGRSLTEAEELLTSADMTRHATLRFVLTDNPALNWTVAEQSVAAGLQVIRGTAVSVTLWRYAASVHTAATVLDLPESDSKLSVRVTVEQDGVELPVFQQDYLPQDSRTPTIELVARDGGTISYNVYINEKFAYRKQLTLP